ncbi:hypothetical protein H0H93_010593, partial [Arthromyces matolae]
LWTLPPEGLAGSITDNVEKAFYSRCPPDKRPKGFSPTIPSPSNNEKEMNTDPEGSKATKLPTYDSSLFKALNSAFFKKTWASGLLLLVSNTLNTTTPLVNKVLLTWLTESYVYFRLTDQEKASGILAEPRGIGYGIGLAFAIFVMQ